MLALIDIDGTLLLGAPAAHTAALATAMADVWDVAATPGDVTAIRPAGRTDREIARLVLRAHGVADERISDRMATWIARAVELHADLEREAPPPAVAPGAAEGLALMREAGVALALLTGNLEPIARAKMAAAGLAGWFPPGGGAFGSDREHRDELVPVALARHGRPAAAVVVGDTPRDITCARAGAARCVAVTTGAYDEMALAAADAVAPGLVGAAEVLAGWSGAPRPSAATTRA
ncbi:HAD family hydrolase [Miltoncostaea marina]|uniref:HAD family hydrolase n=1 Tax=Miltoncostaea marina TaxID=2843215 RepID=UPI001C3D5A24|nr:haloacid dehalogenase-like hydrolase [Miltoncostaea marina]